MKYLKIILVLVLLVIPAILFAQQSVPADAVPEVGTVTAADGLDSTVVDTVITTPSPFEFDKIFTIDNIAKLFGVNPILFGVFVAMIFGLTEFFKRKVKKGGELFFVDNRSIPLPFVVGVFLALVVPLNFSLWETIRFGIQGAIAAILIYIFGTFVFGGAPSRNP